MRYAVSLFALSFVSTPSADAQAGAWADKMFKGATNHEFGSVPRGAQLYHRFHMSNIWSVPIEITNMRTSCGCVSITPSSKYLQPRESGYLDVTMDTTKFTGPKTVSIYVTLGPQYISTATLRVAAVSRTDVVFNPGQINFGVVQRGQTAEQSIDVEYAGVLDWRVADVDKGSAPVDIAVNELYRGQGRVGYRLRTTLLAEAPAGLLKQEIFLKTNDPASPLVPVLVEAMVQAPLTAKPSVLKVEGARIGEAFTRRVNVVGSRPFRIVSIDGLGNGIQADLPTTAAAVQTLTLNCTLTEAGELKRRLQIQTDIPGQPPVSVFIEGTVN